MNHSPSLLAGLVTTITDIVQEEHIALLWRIPCPDQYGYLLQDYKYGAPASVKIELHTLEAALSSVGKVYAWVPFLLYSVYGRVWISKLYGVVLSDCMGHIAVRLSVVHVHSF